MVPDKRNSEAKKDAVTDGISDANAPDPAAILKNDVVASELAARNIDHRVRSEAPIRNDEKHEDSAGKQKKQLVK